MKKKELENSVSDLFKNVDELQFRLNSLENSHVERNISRYTCVSLALEYFKSQYGAGMIVVPFSQDELFALAETLYAYCNGLVDKN